MAPVTTVETEMNAADPGDRTLSDWAARMKRAPAGGPGSRVPVLPKPPDSDAADAEALRAARRFHYGRPGDDSELPPPGAAFLPALLHPFRDPAAVRHEFPLALLPPDAAADPQRVSAPLSELLRSGLSDFASGEDDARILKDNLPRLERLVAAAVSEADGPFDARELLRAAGADMVAELSLRSEATRQLESDLTKLIETVPPTTTLIGIGEQTVVLLFIHAVRHRTAMRQALREEITTTHRRLRELLRSEHGREAQGRDPESLGKSMGSGGAPYIDPQRLARIVGAPRGSASMSPKRRERLESVVKTLGDHLERSDGTLSVAAGTPAPAGLEESIAWKLVKTKVCRAATRMFDEQAARFAPILGALRIGKLELAGAYDPARHDALLDSFRWEFFSREELLSLPPVLAVVSAQEAGGAGMADFSALLLSGRDVDVLVTVNPEDHPVLAPHGEQVAGHRFELAYLGVSHRDAQVHQSSSARPRHLTEGFLCSLEGTCPALHVVTHNPPAGGHVRTLGAWMYAAAALEGRAHPFFHYNPEAGATWARRFDFAENPCPDEDWPAYDLPCRTHDGADATRPVAFTFADFALLDEGHHGHFRLLPSACASDELVEAAAYLQLDLAEADRRLPFVWAVDKDGSMHRLVISRSLVAACRDRLDYWRTLQELAGVRNEHVREAVERERERLGKTFEAEREDLAAAHAAALDRVRTETAREALGKLAQSLLGADVESVISTALRSPAPAPAAPPTVPAETESAPAPEAEAVEEEEEEDAGFDEPWIDSALCTSCNDCLQVNPQVFVYNSNKQATIGDARAGTYEQLVRAAELCPAKCIHPGKPLNPDEPNLEELKKRAKPFNQ